MPSLFAFFLPASASSSSVLSPEDVNLYGHLSGALLQVIGSNTAFVLAGIWLTKSGYSIAGTFSIIAGLFSLLAFIITGYVSIKGPVLGLYAGAWERMSVWVMIIWLTIAAIACLKISPKSVA